MSKATVTIELDLSKVSNTQFIVELRERISELSNTLSTRELMEIEKVIQATIDYRNICNKQISILDYETIQEIPPKKER